MEGIENPKRRYRAIRVSSEEAFDRIDAPWAAIEGNPWRFPYAPAARAQVCADFHTGGLWVRLEAVERRNDMRAEVRKTNGRVWEDSCLEFFFNPMPEAGLGYLNFEANSLGVMLFGVHNGRMDGQVTDIDESAFRMRVFYEYLPENRLRWTLRYFVPFAYIRRWFDSFEPVPDMRITGNFYKCGDLCPQEHYLTWSPIDYPQPSFHRPECFGEILL